MPFIWTEGWEAGREKGEKKYRKGEKKDEEHFYVVRSISMLCYREGSSCQGEKQRARKKEGEIRIYKF